MSPAQLRQELMRNADARARVESQRVAAQTALDLALGAPPYTYSTTSVAQARAEVSTTDGRLRDLEARELALRAQLPDPSTVLDAERTCVQLHGTLAAQAAQFEAHTAAAIAALNETERLMRQLAALRATAEHTRRTLIDVAVNAGLSVPALTCVDLPPQLTTVMRLQALVLAALVVGDVDPSDTVEIELAAARLGGVAA